MYEQYLRHYWYYGYPASFIDPNAPSTVFPAHIPPVNNPMYAPPSIFPGYTAPVNNPIYAPSSISPAYTTSVKGEFNTQLPPSMTNKKEAYSTDFFSKINPLISKHYAQLGL